MRLPGNPAIWGRAFRLLVSFGFIWLLLRLVSPRQIAAVLRSADPPFLCAAVLVALADRGFMIAKWYPLLRVQLPAARFIPAMRAYWASSFASIILPSSVGADAVRAYALGRASGAVVEVGASIVTERLLGMLASGILCLAALALALRAHVNVGVLLPWALVSIGFALAVLILPFTRWGGQGSAEGMAVPESRLRSVVRRFAAALALYKGRPRMLAGIAVLTILEQTIPIWVLWILSRAIGAAISLQMLMVAVPLTLFLSRFPIAVWGLGVIEVSLVYLLGLFGVPPAQALSLGLAGRAAELIAVLPGAFLWFELTRGAAGSRIGDSSPGR